MPLRLLVATLLCFALVCSARAEVSCPPQPGAATALSCPQAYRSPEEWARASVLLDARIEAVRIAREAVPVWKPRTLGIASAVVLCVPLVGTLGYTLRDRARDRDGWDPTPSDEDQRRRVIRTGFGVAAVGLAGLLVAIPWSKRLRAERDVSTPYWRELRAQRRALDAELRRSAGPTSFALTLSGRF
jgi:hypothetical protein